MEVALECGNPFIPNPLLSIPLALEDGFDGLVLTKSAQDFGAAFAGVVFGVESDSG